MSSKLRGVNAFVKLQLADGLDQLKKLSWTSDPGMKDLSELFIRLNRDDSRLKFERATSETDARK